MTDLMLDPNDTGDIPRIDDLGDDPTRNLRAERDQILGSLGHLRDATDEIPVVTRLPETIAVVEPFALGEWDQPVAPWERVVDTERLTILAPIGAPAADLATPPTTPPPLPKPPRPAAPGRQYRYAGRHRKVREEHPVRGLVWFVVLAAVLTAFGMWQVR